MLNRECSPVLLMTFVILTFIRTAAACQQIRYTADMYYTGLDFSILGLYKPSVASCHRFPGAHTLKIFERHSIFVNQTINSSILFES